MAPIMHLTGTLVSLVSAPRGMRASVSSSWVLGELDPGLAGGGIGRIFVFAEPLPVGEQCVAVDLGVR
jgi:hypothetical protein